jgi:hypothetical protein
MSEPDATPRSVGGLYEQLAVAARFEEAADLTRARQADS